MALIRNTFSLIILLALISNFFVKVVEVGSNGKVVETSEQAQKSQRDLEMEEPRLRRRSTLSLGERRKYSTHHCIDPHQTDPMYRSCHFTDVCFALKGSDYPIEDAQPANLQFFTDENITSEQLKTSIRSQASFRCPKLGCYREDSFLVPQIVPTYADYNKVWSPVSLAMPYMPMNGGNFGHSLGDNVFAFYRLLSLFGLYSDTVNFVPLRMDCADPGQRCELGGTRVLRKVLDAFLLGLNNSKETTEGGHFHAYYEQIVQKEFGWNLRTMPHNNTSLCFENVLTGKYFLTDHGEDENYHGNRMELGNNWLWVGKGDMIRDFRDAYIKHIGIDVDIDLQYNCPNCQTRAKPRETEALDVVVLPRHLRSGQGGWNHTTLLQMLPSCLANHSLTDRRIRLVDMSKLSMKDQVMATATAKVFVSVYGGAAYLSWFLPPGSTLIGLSRANNLYMDSHILSNLPYFRNINFAVQYQNGNQLFFDWEGICEEVVLGIKHYDATLQAASSPCAQVC